MGLQDALGPDQYQHSAAADRPEEGWGEQAAAEHFLPVEKAGKVAGAEPIFQRFGVLPASAYE